MTVRINALLSRLVPTRIVSCSRTAAAVHARLGYPAERLTVIPNGFDLDAFRPDPDAGPSVRRELGLPDHARLVGAFARFHPQKDHRNLCRALGLIARSCPNVQMLLAGAGIDAGNRLLVSWLEAAGAAGCCRLLGEREDMPRLTAALDLAIMGSAFGEAFPLVVGEAMACGVPCVVTEVGDARDMVAETGRVVPVRNPRALAEAVLELLAMAPQERSRLGARARRRIRTEWSLAGIATRYQTLYERLAAAHRRAREPRPERHRD